jgi:hypothetical protein
MLGLIIGVIFENVFGFLEFVFDFDLVSNGWSKKKEGSYNLDSCFA